MKNMYTSAINIQMEVYVWHKILFVSFIIKPEIEMKKITFVTLTIECEY